MSASSIRSSRSRLSIAPSFATTKKACSASASPTGLNRPRKKAACFWTRNGRPTKVAAADTSGATGVYLTSEGVKGGAAWGTRGKWCSLTGHTGDHTVTIAILDHPKNPGYPTYWHARGYGLFAANPLGRSIFDPKQPPFNYTLEKGQTATFRYRVLLISHEASSESLNREAEEFAAQDQ